MTEEAPAVALPPGPLIARIKGHLGEMTRSERRIGEHLARHPLDAAFLPAARLSELVGVSESSVLRFSKALGYVNYPALQLEMQEEIRSRLTRNTAERLREASRRSTDEAEVLRSALDTDSHNLRITRQQANTAEFREFVRWLSSAERVYVVGMRGAAPVADLLGYSLNLLRPEVRLLTHRADMLADQLIGAGPKDVLIAFAFSRQSTHTVKAVDTARRSSATILAITDDPLGPIATRADHTLLVAMQSEAFIQSYTAVAALNHALAAAVGMRLQASAIDRLRDIEASMDRNNVFYSEEG